LEGKLTRLNLPKDARASRLFNSLNDRYLLFVDHLPRSLGKLARQRKTYLGGPDLESFEGVTGLNPVLAATPWLFWEMFSSLKDEIFLDIAEAGMGFVLASIVLDHLVDGQAEAPEEMALFHQALYGHGITKYREVMPSSSSFWAHFDRLAQDHLVGLSVELDVQSNSHEITLEELFTMAHGKVSPIVATTAALAFASNQPKILSSIETSLKHISVASQLLDDVGDWEHDLKVGHNTYFLSRLLHSEEQDSKALSDLVELRHKLEKNWHDVEHLKLVKDWLEDSVAAVEGIECPAWIDYVMGYWSLADKNLTTVMGHHLIHKLHPLMNPPSE
jgi:hypothetical protein